MTLACLVLLADVVIAKCAITYKSTVCMYKGGRMFALDLMYYEFIYKHISSVINKRGEVDIKI